MSLRNALTTMMAALSLVAMLAAGSIIVLTSYLHRTTAVLGAGIRSVQIFEEASADLRIHRRATDPLARAQIEQRLRHRFDVARPYLTSSLEAERMAEARRRADAYVAGAPDGAPGTRGQLDRALEALDGLVEMNIAQARAVEAQAARWDRLSNVLGSGVAAAILLGVGATLLWIRSSAFRPVLALAAAMRRFGAGDKQARAPEIGPDELREIARCFNAMAASLDRQHEREMTFLAGVAHDLRNPLQALKLSLAMVPPDEPLPPEERVQRTLALFRRQVDRLERMVGDFLDTARIEAGKLDLKRDRHDARELVGRAFELFESSSAAHALRMDVPDEPVMIDCDAERVEQVLDNLVSNAIKYSPSGGEVAIRLERRGEDAIISVSDRGLGIAPEERARVFEPFQRSGASASTIPGVGIGLSVARRIVDAHGGRIDLESAPGEGSTFTVRLPCLEAAL